MRLKQFLPLVFFCLAIPLGYFSGKCGVSSSCLYSVYFHEYVFSVFEPIYLFSLYSIPAVLLLPIVKKGVFDVWLRFATAWIILSIIIIASTPTYSHSWFPVYEFVREDAAKLMGILFSGISLFIIAWQSYRSRRTRSV